MYTEPPVALCLLLILVKVAKEAWKLQNLMRWHWGWIVKVYDESNDDLTQWTRNLWQEVKANRLLKLNALCWPEWRLVTEVLDVRMADVQLVAGSYTYIHTRIHLFFYIYVYIKGENFDAKGMLHPRPWTSCILSVLWKYQREYSVLRLLSANHKPVLMYWEVSVL